MTSPAISDAAVQNATDKTWDEWFALLDALETRQWSHKEIAQKLQDEYAVSGWWAQSITVEYERFIGRREIGQKSSGDFQTATSKTLPGTMDAVLERWQAHVAGATDFAGVAFAGVPNVSKTDNWRYWRVGLADGSRVNVSIGQKADGKAQLAVAHEKLPDADAVKHWKSFWRARLQEL